MPKEPRELNEHDVLAAVYELLRLAVELESAAKRNQLPTSDREHLTHVFEHTAGRQSLARAVSILLKRKKKRETESRRYRLAHVAGDLAAEAHRIVRTEEAEEVAIATLAEWMSERLLGIFPRAVLSSVEFRDIIEGEAKYVLFGPKKQAAEDSSKRKGKRHFTDDEGWRRRAQQAMHHLDARIRIGRSTVGKLQTELERSARARAVEGDDAAWGSLMVDVVERAMKEVAEATYDVPYDASPKVAREAWRIRPNE